MGKEEESAVVATLSEDVEKHQDAFKQNEFSSSSSSAFERMKKFRVPNVRGSVFLIYAVFAGMFVVGWISLENCPISRMIPLYLIVAGVAGALTKALLSTTDKCLFNTVIVLLVFDLIWQIVGSYFVYREYQPNYDPLSGAHCSRAAYLLAFWMITIQYALIGLFLVLSVCYFVMRGDFKM